MRQLRQPRLAEIVAGSLRDDILSGRLKEGDSLPRQEHLYEEFRVSIPAVREALRILETEGLISVRRGNVGGAVVHLPNAERTARMISMVLQSRNTSLADVSGAVQRIEPVCASLCAERADRDTTLVPRLQEVLNLQRDAIDDANAFTTLARRFHEIIIEDCGNETFKVVVGALEMIWSAHESKVWDEAGRAASRESNPDSSKTRPLRRAALEDHERILGAIEKGDTARASALASKHLAATRSSTLASASQKFVQSNLLNGGDMSHPR